MEKPGRNHPCPCGSGKKYKNCCLHRQQRTPWSQKVRAGLIGMILIGGLVIGVVALINAYNDEGPAKVWSEEHQHWH